VGNGRVINLDLGVKHRHGLRRFVVVASLTTALIASSLVTAAAQVGAGVQFAPAASALVKPRPIATPEPPVPAASARAKPGPTVVDAETLTPAQLTNQIKAADALRAELMKSGAEVAAANSRLERLSAQANSLLAALSVARTAQVDAETEAATQRARLVTLGSQLKVAFDALGHLASDTYIRGGGPLGEVAAIMEALTSPSPDRNTDTLATAGYLVDARGRLLNRLESLRAEQVQTTARATAASSRAVASARQAAEAKSALDVIIVGQRAALVGFKAAEAAQVGRAAGLRGALLRAETAEATAADRRLTQALQDKDFTLLIDESSSCGMDSATYPNGLLPASALCPMYAAAGESLSREAAIGFNAMSKAYEEASGSPLCVTDGYRPYVEQVAVKLASPKLAATPGRSQHGLGLAVDLCGGVQSFAGPAHLWMQRNAPLYGWFHPAWAEPSGVMPEPWHWEFAS
jgi:zinc D-Ala-D-Ala carboxypeptidase